MKKYIIDKSKEIGIDIIGFTNMEKFEELREVLEERRKKRYETEFEESNIEKRISPQMMMGTGKSIIVIGMSYYTHNMNSRKYDGYKVKVSKSSIGLDYHIILKEKLKELADLITDRYGDIDYFIGVDTTPIIDRYLAKKSGIGWYGKNSNIINDEYGSFIFIGYMITDLDIEEDLPSVEKCGTCDICLRSCPVRAIKPNYKLNANRCISYLTQTKKDIPYDLRDKMKESLYGCDICQLVCPKNKYVISNSKDANSEEYVDIEELFEMSNKDFKLKYGKIAFSWRGKNIIKRNAIIVIGNEQNYGNIEFLTSALKDENEMIRKYSAWAILKSDRYIGSKILEEHKLHETSDEVIKEIEKLKAYFKI